MKSILVLAACLAVASSEFLDYDILDKAEYVDSLDELRSLYPMPIEFQREVFKQKQLTVNDLIERHGYPSETHKVVTNDGYILTMFRIPHNRENATITKGAVFIMHGLLASAADWVVMGPEESIAYMLSDAGYDVWLGNARGNTHSRNHTSIKPRRAAFWQFSWNEIGLYDLPAMIDYVLEVTGEEKLSYVGHSQGTTSFFVMTTSLPQYNDKIKSMHALAPVAYMSHMKSPLIRMMTPFANSLEILTKLIGMHEFLPTNKLLVSLADSMCKDQSALQFVCTNTLFMLAGYNPEQLNATALPAILAHVPAGAATRQIVHYAQLVKSATFSKFDFGLFKNMKIYGSAKPPRYDLKKVTCPVALHYSDNDWMANTKDVDILSKELSNVIGKFRIPDPKFNHLDFLWGIDADDLLYKRVLAVMNRYA